MSTERARHLLHGASVQMLLGMAVLTGATVGLGLAAYTTGGNLHDRLADNLRPVAELVGNPYAAEADLPVGTQDGGGIPADEIRCRGCGPSIRERLWEQPFRAVYDEPVMENDNYYDHPNNDASSREENPDDPAPPPPLDESLDTPVRDPIVAGTVAIIHRDGLVRMEDIQGLP
ncbi:hypothetical protein [Rhizorhapis suberifaciens]|uniref:Uncharacterized protein n=1 Tax=Rhizorhapis suberifaciens TaxID=13656 RepID=A0A840HR44_9SPHN|nr:hypothetical protein [Rhizorhapis suberifaciens]MBB4640068.1 hypothetical protein [Rhizorhapis suberifaciens]